MVKTALILAGDSKGLQKVYGMPAVRRLVITARTLGFDRVCVVSRDALLLQAVSDLIGGDAVYHVSDEADLRRTVGEMPFAEDEYVLLLSADHVVDRWSLARLVEAGRGHEAAVLERDGSPGPEAIFFVRASLVPSLIASFSGSPEEAHRFPGADAVRVEAASGLPEILDGGRERVRAAEARLSAAVGKATWERDSLLYRHASRHVSRLMSPGIARTRITANMVTFLNVLIGLAGAYLLSVGGYLFQLAGSLVFLFSTIVDLADGEVARLKLEESDFGHYFDIICDNIVHVAVFVGVALGLARETGNVLFLHLLWVFLGGLALCALILNRILAEHHAGLQHSRLAVRLEALFNNRDFAYLMAFVAIFHRLDWFFVACVFGSYILAAVLGVTRLVSGPAVRYHSDRE